MLRAAMEHAYLAGCFLAAFQRGDLEVMTIMTEGDNNGERRCTAACYDAKGDKCVCCCGGANHGKGLRGALEGQEQRLLGKDGQRLLAELRSQKEFQFA